MIQLCYFIGLYSMELAPLSSFHKATSMGLIKFIYFNTATSMESHPWCIWVGNFPLKAFRNSEISKLGKGRTGVLYEARWGLVGGILVLFTNICWVSKEFLLQGSSVAIWYVEYQRKFFTRGTNSSVGLHFFDVFFWKLFINPRICLNLK